MSALDQVFQNSPVSTTMNEDDKDTQMTMISPMDGGNADDVEEATPEPNSPKQPNEEEEEEKDPLYNDLAPKQNVAQQLKSVVDNVPDQNNIVNPESLPAYSQNLKRATGTIKTMIISNPHSKSNKGRGWIRGSQLSKTHFITRKLRICVQHLKLSTIRSKAWNRSIICSIIPMQLAKTMNTIKTIRMTLNWKMRKKKLANLLVAKNLVHGMV